MRPFLVHRGVRCARRAFLPLALLLAAACDDDGVRPGERSVLLRHASGFVGLWVRETGTRDMVADLTVADSLRLRDDGDGRWVLVYRDLTDAAARHRNVVDVAWWIDGDTVVVSPRCEPVAVCDPAPPWRGTLLPDGRLILWPHFIHSEIPTRVYRKVSR